MYSYLADRCTTDHTWSHVIIEKLFGYVQHSTGIIDEQGNGLSNFKLLLST